MRHSLASPLDFSKFGLKKEVKSKCFLTNDRFRFRMKEPTSLEGITDTQSLEALANQLSDLKDQRRELEEERSEIAIEMEINMSQEVWKRAQENQKGLKDSDERQQAIVEKQIKISQGALTEASRLRKLIMETQNLGELDDQEQNEVTTEPVVDEFVAPEDDGHDSVSRRQETDAGDNHHRPLASSTPWLKAKGDASLEQSMAKSIQAAIESSSSCITKSMLKIEPCVPATGSSYLSMVEWKRWKALLLVTLSTVPGLSEAEKKVTFLRSAGSCLLDILESIPETIGELLNPFTSTIEALDTYFGSEACIRLARLTFKEISQMPNESNVDFIARLMKAIKGCNYSEDYMEDHLMDMIARKSSDVDIRKETQTYDRSSGKRCSYNQLREFALQLESIRRMEREHTSNARKLSGVNAVEPQSSNEASRDSYTQKREKGWLASRDPSRAIARTLISKTEVQVANSVSVIAVVHGTTLFEIVVRPGRRVTVVAEQDIWLANARDQC